MNNESLPPQPEDRGAQPPAFPGPRSASLLAEFKRYVVMDPYPFVVDLARSKGMYLATVDGQMIFDWGGYYGYSYDPYYYNAYGPGYYPYGYAGPGIGLGIIGRGWGVGRGLIGGWRGFRR